MKTLEDFYPIIDKEARKHNIPGMEWQDIAQEVKMRLWLKFKLYDPSKSGLRTWANKVMRNCITDLLRDARAREDDEAIYKSYIVPDYLDKLESEEKIQDRLDELTKKQKQVAELVLDGKKQQEIAKELGISQQSVSKIFKRIVKGVKTNT